MDAEAKKKKVSKWTCKVCKFENLQKAKVCKKCNNDKGATGHQSDDESYYEAADRSLSPNSGGIQKKEIHPSLSILSDVKVIISRFENEIQQYEEAKPAIKSKKHLKQITEDKQQIIQTLDEVSRLLNKQTSDELISTRNQKSQDTILKQKRKRLMAERESQWVAREENLNEEFKEKRQQELTEIEKEWTEKWKIEMEEKWSTIELYIKEDLPEKDLHTRKKQFVDKFTSELKLKLEGMKIFWETRNNIEWTADQLIRKFQWDNESGQLWAVEKQNFNANRADEDASKADTGINTDPKQINEMLEICKSQLENIFKSSKALTKTTEKTQQTIEKHMSNDTEECQKLHKVMAVISTTIERQEEDIKTLMNKKEELKNTFIAAGEQMEQKLAESEQARENLNRKNEDLALKLKTADEEQETIRKQLLMKSKQEQECWRSELQEMKRYIKHQNQVLEESKLMYETELKERQDKCEALISSECQLKKKLKRKDEMAHLAGDLKTADDKTPKESKNGSDILPISLACSEDNEPDFASNDPRCKEERSNYNKPSKLFQPQIKTGKWRCEVCTLENFKNENVCEMCNNIKGTKSELVNAKQNELYPESNIQIRSLSPKDQSRKLP